MNPYMILVSGKSGTGKSSTLRNLPDHPGVWYLNFDAGKALPFKNDFKSKVMEDPKHVEQYLKAAQSDDTCHTLIIDTLSFMLTMYVNMHIMPLAKNQRQNEWGEYASWFQTLMSGPIAQFNKNLIIMVPHQQRD